MTLEDLSSAFFSLNTRLERAEGHGSGIFESVDFNAVLPTETCKELITLRQAQSGMEQQVAATVLKLTDDNRNAPEEVKKDLGEVHARDILRDKTLREELNKMALTLEKGHGILET